MDVLLAVIAVVVVWGAVWFAIRALVRYGRGPVAVCESCGRPARVVLRDGSRWCARCHAVAIEHGYDDGASGWPV